MGQEWIAPEGEDCALPSGDDEPLRDRRPIRKFQSGAVGGVLAAGMLGLRDVLEGPKDDEITIVETVSGDPPTRERIVMRLDPEHPGGSIVMIRDWMPGD